MGPCAKQDTVAWQMKDRPPSTLVQFQTLYLLDTETGQGRAEVPTAGSTSKFFMHTLEILA